MESDLRKWVAICSSLNQWVAPDLCPLAYGEKKLQPRTLACRRILTLSGRLAVAQMLEKHALENQDVEDIRLMPVAKKARRATPSDKSTVGETSPMVPDDNDSEEAEPTEIIDADDDDGEESDLEVTPLVDNSQKHKFVEKKRKKDTGGSRSVKGMKQVLDEQLAKAADIDALPSEERVESLQGLKWDAALKRAAGTKVQDDVSRLKKSIKKKERSIVATKRKVAIKSRALAKEKKAGNKKGKKDRSESSRR